MTQPDTELFTPQEAANWLTNQGRKTHLNTVRHWYRVGRIPVERIHGRYYIELRALRHIAACPFCNPQKARDVVGFE